MNNDEDKKRFYNNLRTHLSISMGFVSVSIGFVTLIFSLILFRDDVSLCENWFLQGLLTIYLIGIFLFMFSVIYYIAGLSSKDSKELEKALKRGNKFIRAGLLILFLTLLIFAYLLQYWVLIIIGAIFYIILIVIFIRGVTLK